VSFKQANYRVTDSVDEINRCLLIRACYTHVAELVSFVPIAFDRACSVHVYRVR